MNTDMYKEKLIAERDLLQEELKGLGAKHDPITGNWETTSPVVDSTSDENDLGDKYEDFETNNEKVETLEERLKDINSALEKLGTEKFGICEVCGAKIEEDRLEANPAARTCIECMEK